MSEEKKGKFSKCEEGKKMFKCRISGVRKKKGRKKNSESKIFLEILLSSCSLVEKLK